MKQIAELAAKVADLERRFAGSMRHGTVASVDPAKQTVRLKLGKDADGNDFLSPNIPYGQTAGAMKFHNPPSVGQQMTMMSPGGDFMQAVAVPMHWSDANVSPSQAGDEHVMTFGSVTATLKGNSLSIKVGGTELLIEGAKITLKSDEVQAVGDVLKHNAKNVGDDHLHTGVTPGGGLTGVPQ